MVRLSLAAVALASVSAASAYFLPPPGAITVGGPKGQYPLLSAALNDTSSDVYFVYAGNYTEGVYIRRPNVIVYGQSLLPRTYLGNCELLLIPKKNKQKLKIGSGHTLA